MNGYTINTEKILVAMAGHRLNQRALARKAELDATTLRNTLKGKSIPNLPTVGKIAMALNLNIEDILIFN